MVKKVYTTLSSENFNISDIQFNKDGVCSACSHNSNKSDIDWSLREKELFKLQLYPETNV